MLWFESNRLSQFMLLFFENTFSHLPSSQIASDPLPSQLPPDDQFYFKVNGKWKCSEENFLIFLHLHLSASTGAPVPCLLCCQQDQCPALLVQLIPSASLSWKYMSLLQIFSISTQMSLFKKQNKNKSPWESLGTAMESSIGHAVMWKCWIFICISLFSKKEG